MNHASTETIASIEKSTNVRSTAIAKGLRGLQRIDPSLAALAMGRLFLTARRHTRPDREKAWMQGAEAFELETSGHRLAAWSWGSGPTVLLAHGWSGRGSQLGAFVRPLVDLGYRVVTWDAQGHGSSSGRFATIPAFRDGVLAAAEATGPLYAIIAHSAGTVATTLACHRGLEVDRLVYLAPVLDPGGFLPQAVDALGLRPEVATMTQSRVERKVGESFSTLSRLAAASMEDLPLLVQHDRLDREVPWNDGRRIAQNWEGARFITTQGLGHRRILRDQKVIDRSLGFLEEDLSLHKRASDVARPHRLRASA